MSPNRFVARAHAKVNLSLRVTARRADGYHDLHTVFQALALHDTLTFHVRPGPFAMTSSSPAIPLDESNLVWRAARAVWARLRRPKHPEGVAVEIVKRIPLQAGLGGGSADACAALLALTRAWEAAIPTAELMEDAARLGADVSFFLVGGTALGRGRGERLRPLTDLPAFDVVLVLPDFGVSTAEAYGWYDADSGELERCRPRWPAPATGDRDSAVLSVAERAPVEWPPPPGEIVNDLQGPVARRRPVLTEIQSVLAGAGARVAAMSGSGSCVFGLFSTAAAAREAAAVAEHRGWRVIITRTLGADEYARRARVRPCRTVAT